jgi:hypothetical protein
MPVSPIVNPVMLALAVGVERRLALLHVIVPPTVTQIMRERPRAPSREEICCKMQEFHCLYREIHDTGLKLS